MSTEINLSKFARNSSSFTSDKPNAKRLLDNDTKKDEGPTRRAKEKRSIPSLHKFLRGSASTEDSLPGTSVSCVSDVKISENDTCVNIDAVDLSSYDSYKSQCDIDVSRTEHLSQKPKKDGLTALEKQVLGLKQQHPGMILMIQNGYKYHFYEEDAEIASKILEIVIFRQHNFLQACVPVGRLSYYVHKFVEKGYKVGVVNQTETTALKAIGENKNVPFSRELSCVYSRATLIGDDVNPQDFEGSSLSRERKATCILSLCEDSSGMNTNIGIAAFDPSTSETIYDSFDDTKTRDELQKRIAHLNPAEILAQQTLSESTKILLKNCGASFEQLSDEEYEFSKTLAAVAVLMSFPSDQHGNFHQPSVNINDLAPVIIKALGALREYLAQFKLQEGLNAARLTSFTSLDKHLQLSASTLQHLEIFLSSSGNEKGSLLSVMDHTHTAFGKRLLEHWLSQPSRDESEIQRRQDAVEELASPNCRVSSLLADILKSLPDIDRGLTNIAYHRCATNNFYRVIEALNFVYQSLEVISVVAEAYVESTYLRELITEITVKLSDVKTLTNNINQSAARSGDKTSILNDYSEFPNVLNNKAEVRSLEQKLNDMRPSIAQVLGVPDFDFITVSGQEYLIQAKKDVVVPLDWVLVNQTKVYRRYRSPEIISCLKRLSQLREKIEVDCEDAWKNVVDYFNKDYIKHKKAVHNIATLDVLLSFSIAAKNSDYCRPKLISSEDSAINIEKGLHPILSEIMEDTGHFIPNDIHLKSAEPMVISGPNMGGKSCFIRQTALLTIMAHTGSFIPAENATITIIDAVHTWMNARDNIMQQKSTFMVEAEAATYILNQATNKSLVLMDEFGRGTSTNDGAALAVATLSYLKSKIGCLLLYVTHYPEVMEFEPDLNYHMGYHLVNEDEDSEGRLIFLYTLVKGPASSSYGLNVAHMAGIPAQIIKTAKDFADRQKDKCSKRKLMRFLREVWRDNRDYIYNSVDKLSEFHIPKELK